MTSLDTLPATLPANDPATVPETGCTLLVENTVGAMLVAPALASGASNETDEPSSLSTGPTATAIANNAMHVTVTAAVMPAVVRRMRRAKAGRVDSRFMACTRAKNSCVFQTNPRRATPSHRGRFNRLSRTPYGAPEIALTQPPRVQNCRAIAAIPEGLKDPEPCTPASGSHTRLKEPKARCP